MFPLMQVMFLKRPAMVYFIDVVVTKAHSPAAALNMLENHFLDNCAK